MSNGRTEERALLCRAGETDELMEVGMNGYPVNRYSEEERCEADKIFTHIEAILIGILNQRFEHINIAFTLLAMLVSERYKNLNKRDISFVNKVRKGFYTTLRQPEPVARIEHKARAKYFNGRIVLSIDPMAPFELLIDSISQHIKSEQEWIFRYISRQCQQCRDQDHDHFLKCFRRRAEKAKAGEEEKFLDEVVGQECLRYDIHRNVRGNIIRDPETTFRAWWLYLRVYHARKNQGATWQEVVAAPWYSKNPPPDQGKTYVHKDLRKAKALIEAAWNNKPLAAVDLPN